MPVAVLPVKTTPPVARSGLKNHGEWISPLVGGRFWLMVTVKFEVL